MVEEIAFLPVTPGREEEFIAVLPKAIGESLARATGLISINVRRGVEDSSTFALIIQWERLEDHTEGFVGSDLFDVWRDHVGDFFSDAPVVKHWREITW